MFFLKKQTTKMQTMKTTLLFIVSLIALSLFAQEKGVAPLANPHSAIGNPQSKTYAVVVGISDYQDPGIPDLRFADRDAAAFAAYLQSPAGGSLPPERIMLLTNKAATTGAIASAMDWLIADCKEGDRAIIYFSGHGDVETRTRFQRGFLLTYDSPPTNYLAGAFALIFLQDIITTLSEQGVQVVMVSDACRAGKLAGSDIGGAQTTNANLSKQYANEIKILSCQPDEFSLEGEQWGGGRGAFSYHLIDGLTGMADGNSDTQVNLLEIGQYLQTKVPAETDPHSQIPLTVGSMKTVLADVDEASLAAVRERKEKALPTIAAIETKGFEEAVLAGMDSIWQKKYEQFTAALERDDLLEPAGSSAYDLYVELSQVPELERLHGVMKRNLATALQEESQQAINAWLRMDEEELAARSRGDLKYTKFVRYLEKAADLLGEGHYMYRTLKAKQYYFDAVDIAVRFEWRTFSLADSTLIWKKQREEKIQKAFELEKNAAFILLEKGYSSEDSSIYYYEKAIELAPNWIFPYANLSGLLIGKGKFEEAESYAAKVKELAPQSSVTYALAAMIHLYKFENKQAEELLLKAVEISPNNVGYLKMLAGAFHNQQKYPDAEKTWLRVLEISPRDNQTYNDLSQLYFSKTFEFDKSEAINHKRLEMRPTDGDAYSDLITTFENSRQLEKIRPLIGEMEKINASVKNWEGQAIIGYAYTALGEPEKGIPYYQRAVKAAPKSSWHYYGFAQTYFILGDYEKGLACLDTAFANGMSYSWVEQASGVPRAYKSPGYKAFAQRVIDARPEMGFGYHLMGKYYEGQGDFATAISYYEQAATLSPEQTQGWMSAGMLAYLDGQKEMAAWHFDFYIKHSSEKNRAQRVAWFYHTHDEYALAEKYLRMALEINPEFHGPYWDLGWLYYSCGYPEKAQQVLDEGMVVYPNVFALKGIKTMIAALSDRSGEPGNAFEALMPERSDMAQIRDCLNLMAAGKYEDAAAAYEAIQIDISDWWVPRMIKFAYVCMLVEKGDLDAAMDEVEKWDSWIFSYQLLHKDDRFASLRETERFKAFVRKQFPEKTTH